jgi:predicted amidohydrolase YtcJ
MLACRMRIQAPLLAIVVAVAACGSKQASSPAAPTPSKALVLRGGVIHTLSPGGPLASFALAVDGRWTCVGDEAKCGAQVPAGAEIVDLHGGSAIPGLADAHGHVAALGLELGAVDLRGARDEAECVARIAARASTLPAGTWVMASGWNQTQWPSQKFPTLEALSKAVPEHPVAAGRVDGHAAWVNARALSIANVTAGTPDPPGGHLERAADGTPTGVLVDNAMGLVEGKIPAPADDVFEAAMVRALDQLVALGITSVHDAGVSARGLAVYRRLALSGRLPLHVYAMLKGGQPLDDLRAQMAEWRAEPTIGPLTVRAVKMFADGALGSRGALLLEPYSDDPKATGLALTPADELRGRILEVAKAGFQPAVHAIGDRAVHEVLDDFLAASRTTPDLRPRVEHMQIIGERDVVVLVASKAVASMQPTHATSDGPWAEERLGHGTPRQKGAYAWRTVLEAGAPLACGSDFPVESPDPFAGIRAAVLRTWPGGPAGGWMPEQRMTLDEALACFTTGAAYAEHAENVRGRIAEGYEADADVLSIDPSAVPTPQLTVSSLNATIALGRVVWRRGS